MTHRWNGLEGVSLARQYVLDRYLGGDASSSFFLASGGPDGRQVAVKLMPEDPATADEDLALWRSVSGLSHPNLLPLLDCGREEVNGQPLLYAVFESPDDSLEAALQQGTLTDREVRDVMDAASSALRYLHENGFVHASIDGDHIVAVGDRIKLATDTVRKAGGTATPERDLAALHNLLGVPYNRPQEKPAGPAVPVAVPAAPEPAPFAEPYQTPRKPVPVWVWAAAACVLLAGVWGLVHKPAPQQVAVTPEANAATPAPAAATPAPTAPAPVEVRTPVHAAQRNVSPHASWRVIAYTYRRYGDAEKQVRHMNRRWAGFHAEVFAPKGNGRPPYLIALGGPVSREEAVSLQKRARAAGLPRRTFIHNYSD